MGDNHRILQAVKDVHQAQAVRTAGYACQDQLPGSDPAFLKQDRVNLVQHTKNYNWNYWLLSLAGEGASC
jgi:hypothetical protein